MNVVFTVKHIINDLITLRSAVNKRWNNFKKHLTASFSEFDTEKIYSKFQMMNDEESQVLNG